MTEYMRAAKAGASIFVSFHLNSSTSTSAKGAEVIVQDSWKPEVAQQGKELANDIMDELTAIGLQKRSIYSKDTTLEMKNIQMDQNQIIFRFRLQRKKIIFLEL